MVDGHVYAYKIERICSHLTFCRWTVCVLWLQLLRKRKILTSPDMRASEYRSIAFSPDSKYLATLGSAPDWTLTYWHWEKSKALAISHTGHPVSAGPVEQVPLVAAKLFHVTYTYVNVK